MRSALPRPCRARCCRAGRLGRECGFTLLDYEWGGSVITDDDKQFFDGFHLDERYGLPDWTQELFGDIAR